MAPRFLGNTLTLTLTHTHTLVCFPTSSPTSSLSLPFPSLTRPRGFLLASCGLVWFGLVWFGSWSKLAMRQNERKRKVLADGVVVVNCADSALS